MYAAAQSMSSGVMGLGTAFLLNKPFNDAQMAHNTKVTEDPK